MLEIMAPKDADTMMNVKNHPKKGVKEMIFNKTNVNNSIPTIFIKLKSFWLTNETTFVITIELITAARKIEIA